jgi:hypothetical protein
LPSKSRQGLQRALLPLTGDERRAIALLAREVTAAAQMRLEPLAPEGAILLAQAPFAQGVCCAIRCHVVSPITLGLIVRHAACLSLAALAS